MVLTLRPLIRLGLIEWLRLKGTIDCGTFGSKTEQEMDIEKQSHMDEYSNLVGIVFSLIGTFIWGLRRSPDRADEVFVVMVKNK